MYTEFNGRVWSSEEAYLLHKSYVCKNFESSLALECYSDLSGDHSYDQDIAFKMLKDYRKNKDKMTEQELLAAVEIIAQKFDELFDKVGRDKFVFYDDGNINYKG